MTDATATPVGERENAGEEMGESTPVPEAESFPPYPPYAVEPAPPSVADTIIAGRHLRVHHKSKPKEIVRAPPKPARPRGPKATDVKQSKRASRAHARCLRRHNAVLTDRLEFMSKPDKRAIINLWREYGRVLPEDTIGRLRNMLDADEPFKPEQAYEYFINIRKAKKKTAAKFRVNGIKKDMATMVSSEKRYAWARNATVAFAKGILRRLARPGRYALADGMLRLSDMILRDICGIMKLRTPSRCCPHPKAKFIIEMADKVAIWIDEVLEESEERMLMMDFDEDDEVEQSKADDERPAKPPDAGIAPTGSTESGSPTSDSAATTPAAMDTPAAGTPANNTPATGTPAASNPVTPATSQTKLAKG